MSLALVLLLACPTQAPAVDREPRPLRVEGADGTLRSSTVSGPRFHAPELFAGGEDFFNPRLERLRREGRLADVVEGEPGEFRRQLKLRAWVHARWPIDNDQSFSGDAFAILERAKRGEGFHCAHSMTVQQAVLSSVGYVARNLGVDVDHEKYGRSRHHGVNEVWSNEYAQWVLLDAKYDVHYEREGRPLSALEIHEAVRSGKTDGILRVRGIDRKPVTMGEYGSPEATIDSYWWVSYPLRQDSFTQPHWSGGSRLVVPDNEHFRTTTWLRGGAAGLAKHWAYEAKAFIPTADRHWIEWTPGVPSLRVRQSAPGRLTLELRSATPNFKAYRVRRDDGPFQELPGTRFAWDLVEGSNRLEVRSRNLFDVDSPAVTATLVFGKPDR